jgi:hypothetical protein
MIATLRKDSQEAQSSDVNVSWKNLPKELSPLEQDIANIEDLKHPDPVCVVEMKIFHDPGGFRVADISTIEIG